MGLELANWSDKKIQVKWPLISFDYLEGVEIAGILQGNIKNVKESHLATV